MLSISCAATIPEYDNIFSRQIEAFGKKGDLVIALSTSGNSRNVVIAVEKANVLGCEVFGITGSTGGKLKELIKDSKLIMIGSDRTSFIQESTIAIGHIISKIVEDNI